MIEDISIILLKLNLLLNGSIDIDEIFVCISTLLTRTFINISFQYIFCLIYCTFLNQYIWIFFISWIFILIFKKILVKLTNWIHIFYYSTLHLQPKNSEISRNLPLFTYSGTWPHLMKTFTQFISEKCHICTPSLLIILRKIFIQKMPIDPPGQKAQIPHLN